MRCNLRFASDRIGAAWVAPATMLVGGAFMKFNKLILNYVPNCQTGRAWAGNTKDATGILCKQREREREGLWCLQELLTSQQWTVRLSDRQRQLGPYVLQRKSKIKQSISYDQIGPLAPHSHQRFSTRFQLGLSLQSPLLPSPLYLSILMASFLGTLGQRLGLCANNGFVN